jgi:hypothetical protein
MARYIIREAMTRQTSNTPLLIIPLMLHIRKPTLTPTPNIRGMITSNPDVLTIQKQDVTDRSV